MVEQRRLGFLGWFFRAFAAALGTVVGLLCGAAILGSAALVWQERMGGEIDLEMTAPVIETDLDLAIETDTDPPNSGQDNLQSMAMLEAAYLSAAENRIVEWAEMRIQS